MYNFKSKKTLLIIVSIISVWSMTMSGCKDKKEDDPKPVIEAPKPLFKFTSNGKDFKGIASESFADTLTDVSKDKMIEIITYNADSSEGLQFLIKARATGTYLLNTPTTTYGSQVFNYFNPSQIYESIAGTVTITKYDLANKKISGTFEIKLGRSSKSTIVEKENTKGEFNDVKFTK